MQGFVPQRSFIAMSSTCIDSVLMVCGTPDECYRLIMIHGEFFRHADTSRQF
jgi:hypothetical protein